MKEFNGFNIPDKATHAAVGNVNGCYFLVGRKWYSSSSRDMTDGSWKTSSHQVQEGRPLKVVREYVELCTNMNGGVVEL